MENDMFEFEYDVCLPDYLADPFYEEDLTSDDDILVIHLEDK